jgi:hypothetical protein
MIRLIFLSLLLVAASAHAAKSCKSSVGSDFITVPISRIR